MDTARKSRPLAEDDVNRLRARAETVPGFDGLEKVLRFSLPGREGDAGRDRASTLSARDISQAMDLVHEAAQSIRAAEERARDGEARTQALLQRATEELKAAEARVQASEAKARAAETRAQESEARASESEGWLRQIFATISEELPRR